MIVNLRKIGYLILRNLKLYFKDTMTFFVSLITPIILFVLFITFLKTMYENNLLSITSGFELSNKQINAFTGGWLFSSVISTSCITVSFCSGIMVVDKINNADIDFKVSPVKDYILKLGYVFSNLLASFIVCMILLGIGLIYLGFAGFYITFIDILLIILNIILTSLIGTLIANIIWTFTRSQGVMSGVCTFISALYGFICGAYMPMSMMGESIKKVLAFLPCTYSTILFRKNFLSGVVRDMENTLPSPLIDAIRETFDISYVPFNEEISIVSMYIIILSTCLVLLLVLSLLSCKKIFKFKR